jgi:hypothetical protein
MDSVDPMRITAIRWLFTAGSPVSQYDVDVTLDNLHFMTAAVDGGVVTDAAPSSNQRARGCRWCPPRGLPLGPWIPSCPSRCAD